MIKSMTGYGLASIETENFTASVEIKTLNSKFLDLTLRSPRQFSDKELEIRNLVSLGLERGKVHLAIDFIDKKGEELPVVINEQLFTAFYQKYKHLAEQVGDTTGELFKLSIQSPNVMVSNVERKSDGGDWEHVKSIIQKAIENCNQFRADEGLVLLGKFTENIANIREGLERIKEIDPVRKERVRSRISNNFKDWLEENSFDQNRFEQELIYYFEKIDITEEIVRLSTHLDYFMKNLNEGDFQGKKLGFISQEIGREINTIGSKANDAHMQKDVVLMKDELEKIKEQLLNIL
jgi:uncharacterized protein (TIGR00255 family)